MKYRYLTFVAVVLALVGCETVVKFEVPELEDQLVIHGLMLPDTTNHLSIGISQNILDDYGSGQNLEPRDAVVYIEGNGIQYPFYYDMNTYSYKLNVKALEVGTNYILRASYNQLPIAEGSFQIPEAVSFEITDIRNSGTNNNPETTYSIQINDNGSTRQYYMARIAYQYLSEPQDGSEPEYLYSFSGLESNFPGTQEIYINRPELLIYNGNFDQSNELDLIESDYVNDFPQQRDGIYTGKFLALYHISKSYYDYLLSANANEDAQQNPLAEPVQIRSNVTNGFGVIGGASVYLVRLPDPQLSGK